MFDSFSADITAVATTIGGLASLYSAWCIYTSKQASLSIEGHDFHRIPNTNSALIDIKFTSNKPIYIKSISYVGGRISLAQLKQEPVKKFTLGLLVTPTKETTPTSPRVSTHFSDMCFAITPLPKDGAPIKLKVDIGIRFYSPVYEFWPSDFFGSLKPDFGKWV